MPKSRKNPNRKKQLNDYKLVKQIEKQLVRNMSTQNAGTPNVPQQEGLPEVKHVPYWSSKEPLEIIGIEFEAMNNFIAQAQNAVYACNSVMNRNILNGKIKVKFEKLNDSKTDYVEMTEAEQEPYKKDFEAMVNSLKQREAELNQSKVSEPQPTAPAETQETPVIQMNPQPEPVPELISE